jgi:hypothetical protein
MTFEEALKCMREGKEVKYRNDVYYIDKKGRLRVRYSDVEMRLIPSFTAEQVMSEEWEINMLKNQKKINILEGNVKDDNIKSGKTKHGDFIVKYLEEGSHYKVKEINVMENVAQRNSQDLNEQWKKGELENNWYYIRTTNGIEKWEYIKQSHGFGYDEIEWVEEVLAPVPSYKEWQKLKEFADYSLHNRDELTRQINFWMDKHTQIEKENLQLKELLKECRDYLEDDSPLSMASMIKKIDEVLQ